MARVGGGRKKENWPKNTDSDENLSCTTRRTLMERCMRKIVLGGSVRALSLGLGLALLAVSLPAQVVTVTIEGRVYDQTGGRDSAGDGDGAEYLHRILSHHDRNFHRRLPVLLPSGRRLHLHRRQIRLPETGEESASGCWRQRQPGFRARARAGERGSDGAGCGRGGRTHAHHGEHGD